MKLNAIALAACLLSTALQAQSLDNFESGNLSAYTEVGVGGNATVTTAAAYVGSFGLEFISGSASWRYRTDVTAQPGDRIRARVQMSNDGRVYLGFGASPSGCWSAVLAPNTNELLLQQNTGYGYSDRSSSAHTFQAGVWRMVEIDWAANGMVVVNLYDELGVTLLKSTPPVQGPTTGGGIAMRGFAIGSGSQFLDEITKDLFAPSFCGGEAQGLGCPCGNTNDGSTPTAGCTNSAGSPGALLEVSGIPKVGNSTLQLTASGLPPLTAGIYFQGASLLGGGSGMFFGDGRLCAGGQIFRLQVVFADAQGSSQSSVNIGTVGVVNQPGTRVYQLWYHDPAGGPCGNGFNTTNAREVTWAL